MAHQLAKKYLRAGINWIDRIIGLRKIMHEGMIEESHPLEGDRAIEWSWVIANLPKQPVEVLDLGCVQSVLTGIASRLGHKVTAVDLREIEYEMENVTFIKDDITKIDLHLKRFDIIMNCSMIEHVGLGGRYGSSEQRDGDIIAMKLLKTILSPSGYMVLTIPIGIDAVFLPQHRIYGENRLPLLLKEYSIIKDEYWHKAATQKWTRCNKEKALSIKGSNNFYALGLFNLKK